MARKQQIGAAGEEAAARFLARHGLRILHRNLRLGRAGELDIVALERTTLVLVEVKARLASETLGGFGNITPTKQRKLYELGQAYLQRYPGNYTAVRLDAIEVVFPDETLKRPQLNHLPDAFHL